MERNTTSTKEECEEKKKKENKEMERTQGGKEKPGRGK